MPGAGSAATSSTASGSVKRGGTMTAGTTATVCEPKGIVFSVNPLVKHSPRGNNSRSITVDSPPTLSDLARPVTPLPLASATILPAYTSEETVLRCRYEYRASLDRMRPTSCHANPRHSSSTRLSSSSVATRPRSQPGLVARARDQAVSRWSAPVCS